MIYHFIFNFTTNLLKEKINFDITALRTRKNNAEKCIKIYFVTHRVLKKIHARHYQ